MNSIGAVEMTEESYLSTEEVETLSYCVADVDRLVKRIDGRLFSWSDFTNTPKAYESDFERWAKSTDILISAHFWGQDAPVYLSKEDLKRKDMRIRMIGDVTCDIEGSIKSTVRSSTHDAPYYDYNPLTGMEEPAFSSDLNISVMAVDTCPNALAMDTSEYFGKMLIKHVFEPLLNGFESRVINGSIITSSGELTEKFSYLENFAKGL